VFEPLRAVATPVVLTGVALGLALSGCSAKDAAKAGNTGGDSSQITVDAVDSACTLSAKQVGKGRHTFAITNNGTKVTEFYVYGRNNEVLGEAENISPGLQRTLDVDFGEPGVYRAACKPGMVGDGISTELTVTG
jgi:iron uptake system component EfeO